MKLLYFAWVRERVGVSEEDVTPPPEVTTVAALLDWLRGRGPGYRNALADARAVRVAVNQVYAQGDQAVRPGDEIALFPPVTGG
jgi:molybdopterin synthase sulfur carrier subunit